MGSHHRGRAVGRRHPPLIRSGRTRDAFVAGTVAAILSGVPSTVWNLATGADLVASTAAAGTLVLDARSSRLRLLAAGVLAHIAVSLGWAQVLARVLPRRHTVVAGATAGAAIAALDLGVIARRYPAVRALPRASQLLDHLAYGALVGAVLRRRLQDANL